MTLASNLTTYPLHILRAHGLPTSPFPNGLRAYVKIRAGDFSAATQTRQQGGDPVWNERFPIPLAEDLSLRLLLRMKHSKRVRFPSRSNPCLGSIQIDMNDLLQRILEPEISLTLMDPNGNNDGKDRGSIIIRLIVPLPTPQVQRCGFTILSEGKNEMGGPIVDIVFVHGLGGHPKGTWTKTVAKPNRRGIDRGDDREVYWPRDLLPQELKNARILTYGYDSDVFRSPSQVNHTNILRLSTDMLLALEGERRDDSGRPIIFIAHSLGGILVKDALYQSSSAAKYKEHLLSIYKSTYGIVFLGTPHRGSNWVAFGKKLCHLAFGYAHTEVIDALKPGSEVLKRIAQNFGIMLKDDAFKIHSFVETKDISGIPGLSGKIVEEDSATIDDASEIPESIDDDHIGMCKFAGIDDNNFRKVSRVVQRFVKGISCRVRSDFIDGTPWRLSSHFTGRGKEVDFLRNALRKVERGVPSCCVIYGMPGIGKSQLVLHYAKTSFQEGWYSYMFWISATSIDKFRQGLTHVLDLVYPDPRWQGQEEAKLVAARRCLETHDRWLLILDNVHENTLDSLQTYLPCRCSRGNILFTTRSAVMADNLTKMMGARNSKLPLLSLELGDAANLLLKQADVTETPPRLARSQQLVESVGRLPLAIVQAGSFIKQTGITLDEMWELYKGKQKMEVLEWDDGSIWHQDRSVKRTFAELLNQLKEESPDIGYLFKILSFLDPENIPIGMIVAGVNELSPQYPPQDIPSHPQDDSDISCQLRSLVALIRTPVKLLTAIQRLQALSLIDYQPGDQLGNQSDVRDPSLSMHDLVRVIAQEGAKNEITDPESPQQWGECENLLPHLRSLNGWWKCEYGTNLELIWANEGIARYQQSRRRIQEIGVSRNQVPGVNEIEFAPPAQLYT